MLEVDDQIAQILKISSAFTPPPPEGFVSPMTWGVESSVTERFVAAGVPSEKISFSRDTFTFNCPGTPAEFVGRFKNYYAGQLLMGDTGALLPLFANRGQQ